MSERVAIIGVGYTPLRPISPEVSFREMIFEAPVKAYADAGIGPRTSAPSFPSPKTIPRERP